MMDCAVSLFWFVVGMALYQAGKFAVLSYLNRKP
jgi:hypothetical protein